MAIKIQGSTIIDDDRQLTAYRESVTTANNISGTYTVDLSSSNSFDLTIVANTSLSFSNVANSGIMQSATLIIRQGNTDENLITWPASVYWSFDEEPVLVSNSAGAYDVITLFTVDGGTTFSGAHALASVNVT